METTPRRCVRTKKDGSPCRKSPVKGATVCTSHGGSAPQVRAKAAERQVEEQARQVLAHHGVVPVDDPFAALAELAGEVLSWKNAMARKVDALTSLRYEAAGAGTEQVRGEVVLLERAMDRCAAVLGMIAKLDIDDRLARISEKQADAIVRAVDAALASAGVSGAAASHARQVAARELRVVK